MITREIEVLLPAGLHILNVTNLKKIIDDSESSAFIQKGERMANCRDPISVLNLSVKYRDTVSILCDGIDEDETLDLIEHFLKNYK